jgi:hypothetical protein
LPRIPRQLYKDLSYILLVAKDKYSVTDSSF